MIASKLQEELIDIIIHNKEVNDYELIVYKYVFISELKIPLFEESGIEILDEGFVLYIIPDDLEFNVLRKLDDAFDKFELNFMANPYGLIKLKFSR